MWAFSLALAVVDFFSEEPFDFVSLEPFEMGEGGGTPLEPKEIAL